MKVDEEAANNDQRFQEDMATLEVETEKVDRCRASALKLCLAAEDPTTGRRAVNLANDLGEPQ